MDRIIKVFELVIGEIVGVGEGAFAYGAYEGEGGVEHYVCFFCLIDISIGIGEREGTVVGESATYAGNAEKGN